MSSENKEEKQTTWGTGGFFSNRELGSLVLLGLTPAFCLTFWYTCYYLDGSLLNLWEKINEIGLFNFLIEMWPTPFNPLVWKIIFAYMAFELALMKLVPGARFEATVTPTGHVPVYKANGFQCYLISIATLLGLAWKGYNIGIIYDLMGEFLSSMNVFALVFCFVIMLKGLTFPSTKDSGSNGSWIVNYFWGTELYPRIFGFDVKQFTNCRFGMMYWQLGVICYAYRQYTEYGYISSSMLVSVLLQTVYVGKFFYWETGYFCSMDIQHDRAGYYLMWGCMVWVPSMYTMHTYFLTRHPILLSVPVTLAMLSFGILSIWINYDCDKQRQEFRRTNGTALVWGKAPEFVVAQYTTADGEQRSSLLLASGWWGLARHFHYIPEIAAAFFWSVPGYTHLLPYFYPVYLTILLFDRAWRDDARCAAKYKQFWIMYCEKVPFKIIPGII